MRSNQVQRVDASVPGLLSFYDLAVTDDMLSVFHSEIDQIIATQINLPTVIVKNHTTKYFNQAL
jgi:hypothetical protein